MSRQKHCFKCNHFKPMVGGGLVRTSNGRKRFTCGQCLPKVGNQLVLRYVAKPKEARTAPPSTPLPAAGHPA